MEWEDLSVPQQKIYLERAAYLLDKGYYKIMESEHHDQIEVLAIMIYKRNNSGNNSIQ